MKTDAWVANVEERKPALHTSASLDYLPIVALCLLGAVVSCFVGQNRYLQRIILLVFLWAAAASSFNIISGYGGQVVFNFNYKASVVSRDQVQVLVRRFEEVLAEVMA